MNADVAKSQFLTAKQKVVLVEVPRKIAQSFPANMGYYVNLSVLV